MKYNFEPSDIRAGLRVRNNTSRGDKPNEHYHYIVGYDPGDERDYDYETKEKHYRMISLVDGMIGCRKTAKQLSAHLTKENFEPCK